MFYITCPFCNGKAYILDWQSICLDCFRRWETTYTEKLREEFKGNTKNIIKGGPHGKKAKEKTET